MLGVVGAGGVALLARLPWLTPWAVLPLFCTTAELQLRVTSSAGASKDALTMGLVLLASLHLVRSREVRRRVLDLWVPVTFLAIVVALYLVNPVGSPLLGWVFGARLFIQAVLLLIIGLSAPQPARTARHMVLALAVMTAAEAVFAAAQQLAGPQALVYQWGYAYGSQVRQTSGGGLRVSGTFNDPFQLMALAVVAAVAGVFLARGRVRWTLLLSAVVITWATSVRTALVQIALILLMAAWRRGWRALTVAACLAAAGAGLFVGLTTSTAEYPGAVRKPLLLGLNGRTTAWSLAVKGPSSLLLGNGVGAVGTGSTRGAEGLITSASKYNPKAESKAQFAGSNAFLDSSYLQVQSDTGVAGLVAFVGFVVSLAGWLVRRLPQGAAPWAALALLLTCAVDWVGRASFASYTTGFLTMYVLGVWVAECARASGRDG